MTKLSGLTPQPWVKLWREERGLFARLPLFARALAAEMLKATEMDGTIILGGREPAEALALALGADVGDRRLLRKYLPMLIEVGYVERDGDLLRLPAWHRRQGIDEPRRDASTTRTGRDPNPSRTRVERESDANATRTEREPDASQTRTGRENEAKYAKSHSAPSPNPHVRAREDGEGEKERDKEKEEKGAAAPAAPAGPSDDEQVERRIEELSRRYPAPLLAEVHAACRARRKTGRMAASAWCAALERLGVFELDVAVRAMRTFVDRYGDGSRDENYLIGIARGERDREDRPGRGRSLAMDLGPPAPREAYQEGMDTWEVGAP